MIRFHGKNCFTESGGDQISAMLQKPAKSRYISEVSVAKIGNDHKPSVLIGQRGLIATHALETGTVIGEFEGSRNDGPLDADVEVKEDWGFVSDDYSVEGETNDGVRFRVNPLVGGNGHMEFVNDPLNSSKSANLTWLTVTVEKPKQPVLFHLFMMTTCKVLANDWLTVDYGQDFWTSREFDVA